MGWGATPCLPPLLWPRAPLTQCREVQAVKGERPLAVPRARLACSIRRFGWGRRTWASKFLPWEGLRPQMHRGAGAHSVTVRPVLVEKQLHFPGAREKKKKKGTYKGDACLQVGGVQSRGAGGARGVGAGETGAVCRTACAKNRQSAACVLPAPSPLLEVSSSASLSLDIECRQASSRAPLLCSRHLFLSLSLSPGRVQSTKSIRLEASGDYPPNLSISLSGGKEINRDLPSSGERTGASPALNRGSAHAGREMWGEGLPAHPRGSGRAPHVEASARRPRTPHQRG